MQRESIRKIFQFESRSSDQGGNTTRARNWPLVSEGVVETNRYRAEAVNEGASPGQTSKPQVEPRAVARTKQERQMFFIDIKEPRDAVAKRHSHESCRPDPSDAGVGMVVAFGDVRIGSSQLAGDVIQRRNPRWRKRARGIRKQDAKSVATVHHPPKVVNWTSVRWSLVRTCRLGSPPGKRPGLPCPARR